MAKTGWDRSLGTSKKEQGIITPPAPRRHHCGCWYRGTELWQMCLSHQKGLDNILKNLQDIAKMQHAQKQPSAAEELAKQMEKPAPKPWGDDTTVSESVQVGIITPSEQTEQK